MHQNFGFTGELRGFLCEFLELRACTARIPKTGKMRKTAITSMNLIKGVLYQCLKDMATKGESNKEDYKYVG